MTFISSHLLRGKDEPNSWACVCSHFSMPDAVIHSVPHCLGSRGEQRQQIRIGGQVTSGDEEYNNGYGGGTHREVK